MIRKSTFDFLLALKDNNDRNWFETHRNQYEAARENMLELVTAVLSGLSAIEPSFKDRDPKKCLFRIYRDVRFAKDKSPYKINMSAFFEPNTKFQGEPAYYLHIQPGGSFIAGGVWQPQREQLSAVRQEIVYNEAEFRALLKDKDFKKYFGKLNDEDVLKKKPAGFDNDHPALDLVKYKSYTVSHAVTDEQVMDKTFPAIVVKVFRAMMPMNAFLKRASD